METHVRKVVLIMNISCIIVNYNNSAYLERAVMSVLEQTLPPDEIIIADDASTDSSVEIINRLAAMYGYIRPILRKKNIGAAANRDLAVRAAKGKYIVTLDSDDWFSIDKIEKEYDAIKGSSNCIAISDLTLVDGDGKTIDVIKTGEFCSKTNKEQLRWLVSRKRGGPVQMMFPKQLFVDVGGLNHLQTLYEDWDFKIRAVNAGVKWVHSGVLGYYYWRAGEGLSSSGFIKHSRYKAKVLVRNFSLTPYKKEFAIAVAEFLFFKTVNYLSPKRRTSGFN